MIEKFFECVVDIFVELHFELPKAHAGLGIAGGVLLVETNFDYQ
jgi:hypothetical protein